MCRILSIPRQLQRRLTHIISLLLVAIVVCSGCFSQNALAQNVYTRADCERIVYYISVSSEAYDDLSYSNILPSDEVSPLITEVVLEGSQTITVECDGQTMVTGSDGELVLDLLESMGISISESDLCSEALDAETYDGMCIKITRITGTLEYTEQVIAYETEYYEDATLEIGETQTVVKGKNGVSQSTWEVFYDEGEEISRTLVETTVLTKPVTEVILIHTDRTIIEQDSMVAVASEETLLSEESAVSSALGTITTVTGDVFSYTEVMSCTATAYTGGGKTASGTVARVGEIAVDPSVIPLGSILYIVTDDGYCIYGYCVAEDTGSAIVGNRVDLYFDTYSECINFGRRTVTVYILEPAS